MRRHLLSLLVCCWIMAPAFAGKEDSYVLHEGFESGSIPAGWTQESGTAVEQQWVVESALSTLYPKGTAAGQYRAALRNTTAQTQHYVSKLISPVFNIEETFQPIVVFSHAQPARTGDVDTLRVYYRTSATTRWIKLGEYSRNYSLLQTQWATDTLSLPAKCATYQLAFEGTDNYGYGIALDEIIVRPLPTCEDPSNVSTEGLTASTALLRWNGSLDADSFHVVLTTSKLDDGTDLETLTDAVKDTFTTSFQCTFTGLERNTTYYAHLLSFCNGSTSEWTLNQSFKTQNIDTIPFVATFNMNYVSGTAYFPTYWTVGSDIYDTDGNQKGKPYINTFISESSWKNYSYSQTTCLAFTKTIALGTPEGIPAGNYSYAATPELAVDDISTLLVSFWGSCYKSVGDNYAGGIIVGVMSDPADFATFVPVDTVYITKQQSFDKFYVYLDSYKGEGKYVAFASNFHDKDNVFLLDDVEIVKAGNERYISNFEVTKVLAHKVTVNANLQGAAEAEIIITCDTVDANGNLFFDPSKLPASAIIAKATVTQAQLPYTIDNPAEGCFAQVYIHQINSANYSLPKKILCPMRWDGKSPLTIDFEDDDKDTNGKTIGKWAAKEMDNFATTTYTYTYPFSVITTSQDFCDDAPLWPSSAAGNGYGKSKTAVLMGKEMDARTDGEVMCKQSNGDYIALPEVEDLSHVMLKFYLQGYKNDSISNISVGVLSDPFDVTTFDTVFTVAAGDDKWAPYTVSFANYKGKGKYPALLAGEAASPYKYSTTSSTSSGTWITWKLSYQRVDTITLSQATGCVEPSNVKLTTTDTTVSLSWDALGMTEWVVRIYSAKINSATVTEDALLYCDTVTTASYKNTLLKPRTRYFYSVTTLCEDSVTEETKYGFMTKSSAAENIPYIEDFENCLTNSTLSSIEPVNWYYPRVTSSSSYYPYVYASSAHSGKNSFYFYFPTSSSPAVTSCHAALPLMAEDLNKLQLQFYAKPGGPAYVGDTIWVGVMSDPADFATFDTVALFRLSDVNYKECIVRLDTYTGKGKYIAFAKPLAKQTRSIYIDDIKVDYLSNCEKIQEVSARNATTSGADIYWQKATATQWEVVLTTDTLTLGSVLPAGDTLILSDSIVTVMPFHLTGCPKPNTQYYVYVRAVCDDANRGEWATPAGFKTTCVPLTVGEMGIIDFSHTDELDCWTVGVREGATTSNLPSCNKNQYLYIYNTATTDGAYAAMPPIDIDSITRLQVSFDAHGGSNADYLRELTVGVITNPNDLSTFTAIKTLSLPRVVATTAAYNYGFSEAQRFTVRFDTYMGDYNGDFGKQIMFLSESGESKNYIYIRNIKVDTIPACAEPVSVEAAELNPTDALIAWEDMGGTYEVCLLSADGETVVADTLVTDTSAVHLYDLDAVTKYQAKVRHICGAGDTSVWSNAITFKTACPATMSLPYSEDFEGYASGAGNLPDCWEGFTNSSTAYPYVYTTAKKEGTNGFYLYRSTSYGSYAALPLMNASIKDLQLSFYYRNASSSYSAFFEVGVATDITSIETIDSTFVLVDSIEVVKYASPNNVWHYYSEALSKYTGPEGYLVLRAPKADKSANGGCIYIDNLYIEKAPSCFRPVNFAFVTATPSAVTLTWEPYGKETQWDIAYVPAGTEIGDATPVVLADTTTFAVTGLTHSTKYDFYVRAHCSDTEFSDWSTAVTASTYYQVALADAHWEFDSLSTQVPNAITPTSTSYMQEEGWVFGNPLDPSTIGNNPYIKKNTYYTVGDSTRYYHYAYSDSCALYMGCTSAAKNGVYAVLPLVDADLDTLQISFMGRSIYATGSKVKEVDSIYTVTHAQGSYAHAIKVGTLTDPYDLSTFELLDTYTFATVTSKDTVEGGHWEKVTVPFYGAKGKYIALLTPENVANVVYIDNVVIEAAGCNYPTHIEASVCEHDTVAFTWLSPCEKWDVKVVDEKNNVIDSAEGITQAQWGTGKVSASSDYTFSVQSHCSDDELSGWRSLEFATPCAPVDSTNFVYDFESNLYKYTGSLLLPDCWTGGCTKVGSTTSTTYFPQALANTNNCQYARNTGTTSRALRFYNSTTYAGGYTILPELDVDYKAQALHFWARAAYFYPLSTNKGRLYSANTAYQKSIVVGAIADETDLSTFVPLDTFTYSHSWSSTTNVYSKDDPTGNSYWEEVVIPLADYEGKGRIMLLYPDNGATGYFFIDDMDIVESSFCSTATNLSAAHITSTSALLQWFVAGTDSIKLQVATDEAFADNSPMIVDTVLVKAGGKFALQSLTPATTYYYRVQHLCSDEETADWVVSDFQTDYTVRFFENFAAARTYPENWNRASVLPSNIFSGQKKMEDCYVVETATNWQRAVGSPIASNGIYAPTSTSTSSTVNHWLLTPVVDLTMLDKESILQLSFLLGVSNNDNGLPNTHTPTSDEPDSIFVQDKFFVAVSEDAGETWTLANTTWWSDDENDEADYSYAAMTHAGELFHIDLSEYIGERIRIAFVNYSTKTASKNRIHLANVSLNTTVVEQYAASICRWNDYSDENFTLPETTLQVGTKEYMRYTQASKNGVSDTYTVLSLTVNDNAVTTIYDTICAGEDYNDFNFSIAKAEQSNVYKQKIAGTNTCDSIVELNLYVRPRLYTDIFQTICQGDYYEYNGERYYVSTIKSDTLSSLVTGCDSIVTLRLTVNEILTGTTDYHLCEGDYVEFGKYGKITESGTYIDTLKNAIGCDSVATLNVFAHKTERTTVRGAICQGDRYSYDVWAGLSEAGDYPSKQTSVYGCDSIVTLHLMVAGEDLVLRDSVTTDKLPYILNGEELLDADTQEGLYTKVVDMRCGEVTLIITVGKPTGINNLFVSSLALAQNPVAVGQNIKILGSFAADATLDVISATGGRVYHSAHLSAPVIIPGLPTAGVYLVVVKSGTDVLQSKLIVK